jgi:hypothetical protein
MKYLNLVHSAVQNFGLIIWLKNEVGFEVSVNLKKPSFGVKTIFVSLLEQRLYSLAKRDDVPELVIYFEYSLSNKNLSSKGTKSKAMD